MYDRKMVSHTLLLFDSNYFSLNRKNKFKHIFSLYLLYPFLGFWYVGIMNVPTRKLANESPLIKS